MNKTVQQVNGVDTGLTKIFAGCTAEYERLRPVADAPFLCEYLATIRFGMTQTQVLFVWGGHPPVSPEQTNVMLAVSDRGTFAITALVVNRNMYNVRPVC